MSIVKFLEAFTDERFKGYCLYCGHASATREHAPPRFFLDDPHPENLHVVEACAECNQNFSSDEQFVGCLLNALAVGGVADLSRMRTKVAKTLTRDSRLRQTITQLLEAPDDITGWEFAGQRVDNVLGKIALGHAVYELGEVPLGISASSVAMECVNRMSDQVLAAFEVTGGDDPMGPEFGSRAFIRRVYGIEGWVDVQPAVYRYRVIQAGSGAIVRTIILDYFACEVTLNVDDFSD